MNHAGRASAPRRPVGRLAESSRGTLSSRAATPMFPSNVCRVGRERCARDCGRCARGFWSCPQESTPLLSTAQTKFDAMVTLAERLFRGSLGGCTSTPSSVRAPADLGTYRRVRSADVPRSERAARGAPPAGPRTRWSGRSRSSRVSAWNPASRTAVARSSPLKRLARQASSLRPDPRNARHEARRRRNSGFTGCLSPGFDLLPGDGFSWLVATPTVELDSRPALSMRV